MYLFRRIRGLKMMGVGLLVGIVLGGAILLGQGQAAQAQSGPTVRIDVGDFFFIPDPVTISVGTTGRWVHVGNIFHTVTSGLRSDPSAGSLFDRNLNTGEETSFTFQTAGTYNYFCRPHGNMNASIIVQANGVATSTPTATATRTPPTPAPTLTPDPRLTERLYLQAVLKAP